MSVTGNSAVMGVTSTLERIEQALKASRRVLVVTHIDPDGDALGTQLAFGRYLRDLGKTVFLPRDSVIPKKYQFLPGVEQVVETRTLDKDLNLDTVLILECPGRDRIGTAVKYISDDLTVVSIDHHKDSVELGSVNWIDVSKSSVGEMAFEYFAVAGYEISPEIATQLYTAIITDTGRFRYASTSPRTMAIAGELIAAGANARDICDKVYYNMPASSMLLTGKVLNTLEYHCDDRLCVLTLTRKMLAEAGASESESDGLVDFTLFTRGVVIGGLFKETDHNSTKVSLRSANGVDVARIAARFGGGGHANASGCEIPMPLEEAKKTVIQMLKEANGREC